MPPSGLAAALSGLLRAGAPPPFGSPRPARGASPGATGRGLHLAGSVRPPGRENALPLASSPATWAPPQKTRAAVLEEAFDQALWF